MSRPVLFSLLALSVLATMHAPVAAELVPDPEPPRPRPRPTYDEEPMGTPYVPRERREWKPVVNTSREQARRVRQAERQAAKRAARDR